MSATRITAAVSFVLAGLLFILSLQYHASSLAIAACLCCIAAVGLLHGKFTKLFLSIASLLFSLLLCEAALLISAPSNVQLETDYPPNYEAKHISLGYLLRPGRHRVREFVAGGRVIYDVVYSIGDNGFRMTKSVGSGRSAYFLGCSYTFGEGLEDEETLPSLFAASNPDFSVTNYGIPGYGLSHGLVILKERIQDENALVVVQTAPWHASRSACIDRWLEGSPRFVVDDGGRPVRAGACDNVLHSVSDIDMLAHSRLYEEGRQLIEALMTSRQQVLGLYLAVLREMKRVADARSQRLVVIYIRAKEYYLRDWGQSNDAIIAAIERMGIELVDVTLSPTYETLPREYIIDELNHHPSAFANRRRADLLTDYLRAIAH